MIPKRWISDPNSGVVKIKENIKRRTVLRIIRYAESNLAGRYTKLNNSMKLVAGRIGQEYNQRKNRKGAYREDRYHATAVESDEHLARCLVYIDTNMVRAGVVNHPSKWPFSGFNEIQKPRRKSVLIDYERLQGLLGASTYVQLRRSHKGWV